MNRLINTGLALALATLMSPALALDRAHPLSTDDLDRGSQLLEREIDRLGRQHNPLIRMETDLTAADGPASDRQGALLASRKDKGRDYGHYAPSKGKHHKKRRQDHGRYYGRGHRYDYGHGHHHDYGHSRRYYPREYWWDDGYYDGVNLNLIFHLDG